MPETYVSTGMLVTQLLLSEPCSQVEMYLTPEKEFLIKWALSGRAPYRGGCISRSLEIISTLLVSGLGA